MERKRIIQIVIIVVALCGIVAIGIGCNRYFKEEQRKAEAEQRKAEEAERMKLIQTHFKELIAFAQEHQENIEKLSIASVEQMKEVMDIYDFDYEKACEVAGIGDGGDVIKEKLYLNTSIIMQSIEAEIDEPQLCPEVVYEYKGGIGRLDIGRVDMYLIYYCTDEPQVVWEYLGSGYAYDCYEQISEHLYAVWNIPRYT